MGYLEQLERDRRLQKLRGKKASRPASKRARGPRFEQLELEQRKELAQFAKLAGKHWRTDLIADCLRGGSRRRVRFLELLCPLVRKYGATWLRRELKVPWEARRG